jgi:hypothetical protein
MRTSELSAAHPKITATHLKLASEPRCHNFGFSHACLLGSELAFEPTDLRAIEKLVTDRGLCLRRG